MNSVRSFFQGCAVFAIIGLVAVGIIVKPAQSSATKAQPTSSTSEAPTTVIEQVTPATVVNATPEPQVTEQTAAPSTPASPTPPTTHLPATAPKKGLVIRGVTMPKDCQDPNVTGLQNLVTYVEQHNDRNAPGYVPDSDVAGYVCGWN